MGPLPGPARPGVKRNGMGGAGRRGQNPVREPTSRSGRHLSKTGVSQFPNRGTTLNPEYSPVTDSAQYREER